MGATKNVMADVDPRDICIKQHELYEENKASHQAQSVGPDGKAYDVDVLRLLCLNEITDYSLSRARYDADAKEVYATQAIQAGDVVTFYPGDSAQYWPPDAKTAVSLRLCSDRVRSRLGEWHPTNKSAMQHVGDSFFICGHPDFHEDRNYLGHLARKNADEANAMLAVFRGIALTVVALRDIEKDEHILLS